MKKVKRPPSLNLDEDENEQQDDIYRDMTRDEKLLIQEIEQTMVADNSQAELKDQNNVTLNEHNIFDNDAEDHDFSEDENSHRGQGVNILQLALQKTNVKKSTLKKQLTINDTIKSEKRVLQTRKNQFDATAALVYGLNISLIHFALFIMTVFIVKWPNVDKVKQFDQTYKDGLFQAIAKDPTMVDKQMEKKTCEDTAINFRLTLVHMAIIHYFLVIVNLFRELFDATLGSIGSFMRLAEVLAVGGYLFGTIYCLQNIAVFQYWNSLKTKYPDHVPLFRQCFLQEGEWSGTALQMSYIEVVIYFVNMLTMIILMMKSRCMKVGIDNDDQFDGQYMSYVVNRIIQGMLQKGAKKFTERRYIDRVKDVDVEGVTIKVKLDGEEFYKIKTQMDDDDETEQAFIDENDALDWIEKCVVGGITKKDLDQQRQSETNGLDMMQNTNIVYHPETTSECQIFCLMIFYYIQNSDTAKMSSDIKDNMNVNDTNFIVICLMIEHVISYITQYFRNYDIYHNGKIDINGVKRAPRETAVGNFQFFLICVLLGFAIKHYISSNESIHDPAHIYQNYWIIIDFMITFLGQTYISMSLYMKVNGEIVKNIYSLYFIQNEYVKKKEYEVKVDTQIDLTKTLMAEFFKKNTTIKLEKPVSVIVPEKDSKEILDLSAVSKNISARSENNMDKTDEKPRNSEIIQKLENLSTPSQSSPKPGESVRRVLEQSSYKKEEVVVEYRNMEESGLGIVEKGSVESVNSKHSQPKQGKSMIIPSQDTLADGGSQISSSEDGSESEKQKSESSCEDDAKHFEKNDWTKSKTKVLQKNNLKELKRQKKLAQQIKVIESDYIFQEVVQIPDDVYNLTIAANMTKNVSPTNLLFAIKQCISVFILQILVNAYFVYESMSFDQFQPFDIYKTFLRVIVPVLMTMKLKKELYGATKMFTYLKQMKGHSKNQKGRFINILLASMQIVTPIMTIGSLIINITQQSQLSGITKAFVTLSFVIGIDDMFAPSLPQEIRDNAEMMNKQNALKLSKDYNTYTLILQRMQRIVLSYICLFSKKHQYWARHHRNKNQTLMQEFANLLINVWYQVLMNFQVIIFNYFGGVICLTVQIVGFSYQMWKKDQE